MKEITPPNPPTVVVPLRGAPVGSLAMRRLTGPSNEGSTLPAASTAANVTGNAAPAATEAGGWACTASLTAWLATAIGTTAAGDSPGALAVRT